MKNEIIAGLGILAIFLFIQNKGSTGISKPVAIIDKIQENKIKIIPVPLINPIKKQLEFLEIQKQDARSFQSDFDRQSQLDLSARHLNVYGTSRLNTDAARRDYSDTYSRINESAKQIKAFIARLDKKSLELEQIV